MEKQVRKQGLRPIENSDVVSQLIRDVLLKLRAMLSDSLLVPDQLLLAGKTLERALCAFLGYSRLGLCHDLLERWHVFQVAA